MFTIWFTTCTPNTLKVACWFTELLSDTPTCKVNILDPVVYHFLSSDLWSCLVRWIKGCTEESTHRNRWYVQSFIKSYSLCWRKWLCIGAKKYHENCSKCTGSRCIRENKFRETAVIIRDEANACLRSTLQICQLILTAVDAIWTVHGWMAEWPHPHIGSSVPHPYPQMYLVGTPSACVTKSL